MKETSLAVKIGLVAFLIAFTAWGVGGWVLTLNVSMGLLGGWCIAAAAMCLMGWLIPLALAAAGLANYCEKSR